MKTSEVLKTRRGDLLARALAGSILLTGLAQGAEFDDLESPTSIPEEGESWTTSQTTRLRALGRVYPWDRLERYQNESLLLWWLSDWKFSKGAWDAVVRPWIATDLLNSSLQAAELLEAHIQYGAGDWDFRVGRFVESWGMVDTFSPLDVLTRRDGRFLPSDPIAIGEVGARFQWHFSGGETFTEPTIAAYWIPFFARTPIAQGKHRFSIESLLPGARFVDSPSPDFVDGNFLAGTLSHSLRSDLVQADLLYVFAKGPGRNPNFVMDPSRTVVLPDYYGVHVAGLGFRGVPMAKALERSTLKVELVYTDPYSLSTTAGSAPRPYFQYAIGVEQDLGSIVIPTSSLSLLCEYLGEVGSDDLAAQLRLFDRDVIFGVNYQWGNLAETELSLSALADVTGENARGQVRISSRIPQIDSGFGVAVEGSWLYFSQDEASPYAGLPDNSDLSLDAYWDF